MILDQKMPQRRNRPNGEVGSPFHRLFPLFHIQPRLVFYSDAIFNAQGRQLAVAEFARCYSTHLTEFFGFLGIKQFEFCRSAIPPWMAVTLSPIDPLPRNSESGGWDST